MNKASLTGLLGLILVTLPFLGIPDQWKVYGTAGAGAIIAVLSYLIIRDRILASMDMGNGERGNESYVESTQSLFK